MKAEETYCVDCGIQFSVPQDWLDRRCADGRPFYCPNGHSLSYKVGPTEADKLRLERDRLKQQLAQKDDAIRDAERALAAQKGQVTKLKKRAVAGACPCCNRTFRQLTLHMKHKHPDFKAEAA